MPSNREILYTIRMRNEARAAVRQLSADLAAQGATVKQVARQLQDAQVQAARMGDSMAKTGTGVSALAASARKLGDAAKGVVAFTKAMSDASSKAPGFNAITKAVDDLDRVFRTSQGMTVHKARLVSLQNVLAALPAQFATAQAAALGLAGVAPPRAPRGSGNAGAPPNGSGPPRPPRRRPPAAVAAPAATRTTSRPSTRRSARRAPASTTCATG